LNLSLGKTQKREKTTSTKQTRKKFGKPQWEARCVRECRFGGSFFRLFRNERVSSSRTLMLSWPIPFLSPCSFHPPCLTLDPRRMNLSSILRCWSDSQLVCQLRVGMDYFVLNPVHVPVSVKWMWKSGGELCQCIRCHYYSVHQDNENQAFILQPCAMVGLDNNTLSKRKPMVKKNGEAQMRRKGKSQMEWQW
jgi:hypothetical protein